MQQQAGWIQGLLFLYGCYMLLFLADYFYLWTPFLGLGIAVPFVFAKSGIKATLLFCCLHTFVFFTVAIYTAVSVGAPFTRLLFQVGRRANILLTNVYRVME